MPSLNEPDASGGRSHDRSGAPAAAWPKGLTTLGPDSACGLRFAPVMTVEPSPAVSLVLQVTIGTTVALEDPCWTFECRSAADARRCAEWLGERPVEVALACRLPGKAALIDLGDRMRREIEAAIEAQNASAREERKRQRKALERASRIDSYLVDKDGQFGINLQRGDAKRGFWCILFRERWERERFRDWFRYQRERFHEFADFLEGNDAVALERRLLREMLDTERRLKAEGVAERGRRPLRFWRGE